MDESNQMIEIEKGIPMPDRRSGASAKYPWANMEVGDSFVMETGASSVGAYTSYANKAYSPKRFSSRKIGPSQARIWRIA